jgi:hypothetical protein
VSSTGGSFGSQSMHVGDDWDVRCDTYPQTTPILTIGAGSTRAHFSIASRELMTAQALAFARELAVQAARFAAECERLHAAQQRACDEGQAAKAAGDAA